MLNLLHHINILGSELESRLKVVRPCHQKLKRVTISLLKVVTQTLQEVEQTITDQMERELLVGLRPKLK